jgi:hypothetical protein
VETRLRESISGVESKISQTEGRLRDSISSLDSKISRHVGWHNGNASERAAKNV